MYATRSRILTPGRVSKNVIDAIGLAIDEVEKIKHHNKNFKPGQFSPKRSENE
jgi:hypothetical protein